MPTQNLQRQILMQGLQHAAGTTLWGKLRHAAHAGHEEGQSTPETLKEGGRARSRSRKPRS